MSALRHCPLCGQDRGGYFDPPLDGWACDDCHARRIANGRAVILAYADTTNAGEPDSDLLDEATLAQDAITDMAHMLEDLGINPQPILARALAHFDTECTAREW